MNAEPLPDDAPRHEEDYSIYPRRQLPNVETLHAIEARLREDEPPLELKPEPVRHPLLAEREFTHGNFSATALIAQRFKEVARNTPNWQSDMTDVQREALEGIFIKIARILSGDPNHKDHWSDIAGGAHLVEERL